MLFWQYFKQKLIPLWNENFCTIDSVYLEFLYVTNFQHLLVRTWKINV